MLDNNEMSLTMGKRLKELRNEKGISHKTLQNTLIEQYGIDISEDSLKNYEVSKVPHSKAYKNNGMNAVYLRCLANFYGVSTDYLLGLSDVKSPNPNVTEVMKYTGLTEDNVNLLHADFDYLHDHLPHTYSSIFHLGEEWFYTLANDLVHLLQNEMVLVRFRELQRIYTKFKDIGAANSFDETITFSDVERVTDRRGLATVPVHDGISFYAAQLAAEIQREIETKYAVPQRTESAFDLLK